MLVESKPESIRIGKKLVRQVAMIPAWIQTTATSSTEPPPYKTQLERSNVLCSPAAPNAAGDLPRPQPEEDESESVKPATQGPWRTKAAHRARPQCQTRSSDAERDHPS